MNRCVLAVIVSIMLCATSSLFAQSSTSAPVNFHIEKDYIPPVLDVVSGTIEFKDENENGVIDANESCKICFDIKNSSRGDGYGCVARVSMSGDTEGISINQINLPVIPHNGQARVEIPIVANANTVTGSVELTIVVDEPNGYGTDPIKCPSIGTHKLNTPLLTLASYRVAGGDNGILERRKEYTIQYAIQNMDQGIANDVRIAVGFPENVNWTDGDDSVQVVQTLLPNETRTFNFTFMANAKADDVIHLPVNFTERTGLYSRCDTITLSLGQYVGGTHTVNVARNDAEVEIQRKSLVSSVDENIPISSGKNANTFVVIIANEEYKNVASVPFALNDGNIFRQYCVNTLAVPEKNIKYLANATGNDIKSTMNWLQNVTEVFDMPNIIFYYAGHGIPDERTKSSYLLPVDGNGSDISTAYKLDDLYALLGSMPASQITVFMDACFSGSKREDGMLASARGVALKAKSGVPQGNMVVFSAALEDETAYPISDEGHGMFTYFLLKKLQESKGKVSLKVLSDYIIKNVGQQSIILNGKRQTPTVTPSSLVATDWEFWTLY